VPTQNTNELSSIGLSIKKNRRTLLFFTVCGTALGVISSFTAPPKYKAKADFILRNPLYDDRGNLYNSGAGSMDYFANEDDLDKIILLSKSDVVVQPVIRRMDLAGTYNIDTTTKRGSLMLENKVLGQLKVFRDEYRALTLTYVDTDPTRAANVANEFVGSLESAMSGFYRDLRVSAHQTILAKITEEDSAINALTDTLALLRREYEIYDLISPSRHNIMLSTIKGNHKPGFERAIEQIQNVESIKDEIVSHRANQVTLANQYATAIDKAGIPLIKVITPAKNNISPMLSSPIIVVICMLTSLLCGILVILVKDGISDRKAERQKTIHI
jgi:uncharacterized protein involved in exopolysaccharide biosynthesis